MSPKMDDAPYFVYQANYTLYQKTHASVLVLEGKVPHKSRTPKIAKND